MGELLGDQRVCCPPPPASQIIGGEAWDPLFIRLCLAELQPCNIMDFVFFQLLKRQVLGESIEIVYFLSTKTADWQERKFQVCLFKIGMEWENLNIGTPKIINFPFGTNGK